MFGKKGISEEPSDWNSFNSRCRLHEYAKQSLEGGEEQAPAFYRAPPPPLAVWPYLIRSVPHLSESSDLSFRARNDCSVLSALLILLASQGRGVALASSDGRRATRLGIAFVLCD